MKILVILVMLALVSGLAFIRLAPSDPARWHVQPEDGPDGLTRNEGSAVWRATYAAPPEQVFAALLDIAAKTPRTHPMVVDTAAQRATFVTRSAWMGFPDYASAAVYAVPGGGGW